jgi:hypothetical protein
VSGSPNPLLEGTLPAGNYHLFLIADGAPARVTIPFGGRGGTTTLSPSEPADVHIETPEPVGRLSNKPPVNFSAGATRSFSGEGGAVDFIMWAEEPLPNEKSEMGSCLYQGYPPPPRALAYEDGCAGRGDWAPVLSGNGPVGKGHGPLGVQGDYESGYLGGWVMAPRTWSVGGYIHSAGPVNQAHLQELWVGFPATGATATRSRAPIVSGAKQTRSLPATGVPAFPLAPAAPVLLLAGALARWTRIHS